MEHTRSVSELLRMTQGLAMCPVDGGWKQRLVSGTATMQWRLRKLWGSLQWSFSAKPSAVKVLRGCLEQFVMMIWIAARHIFRNMKSLVHVLRPGG
jgi:hypothetical protein